MIKNINNFPDSIKKKLNYLLIIDSWYFICRIPLLFILIFLLNIKFPFLLVELTFWLITLVMYLIIHSNFRKFSKEEGSPSLSNWFIWYRITFILYSPFLSFIFFTNNLIRLRTLSEKIEKNKKQVELEKESKQQEKESRKVEKQVEVVLQIKTDVNNITNIVELKKKINKYSSTGITDNDFKYFIQDYCNNNLEEYLTYLDKGFNVINGDNFFNSNKINIDYYINDIFIKYSKNTLNKKELKEWNIIVEKINSEL